MIDKPLKYLSQPQARLFGTSIALGAPIFADDMAPKDCLIIKLLRCPYPSAEIMSVDKTAAQKVPGVVAVFTWEDIPPTNMYAACGGEYTHCDRIILTKHARYEGDPVALVAAENEIAAAAALRLLRPKWRIKNPLLNVAEALDNEIVVHGDHLDRIISPSQTSGYDSGAYQPERNLLKEIVYDYGDTSAALANSDIIVECSTETGQQAHAMLETHRSYCYIDKTGQYVVVGPFQTAFTTLFAISRGAGIAMHKLRIIKTQVGGGFGGKNLLNPEIYTAFLTKMTGRPSKLVFTRRECFSASGTRHAIQIGLKVGALKDGTVVAMDNTWITDAGAYAEVTAGIMFTGAHNILPLYPRVSNVRVHQYGLYTNKITGCAFRGYGAPQATFNFNQAMTLLADKLHMDITDLHLKNIGNVGDSHPLMNGYTEATPVTLTSTALAECIARGKAAIRWDERLHTPADDDYYYGVGMAIAAHGSGVARVDRGNASIRLNFNETFTVFSGHCDIGTGSDTVIVNIAAEVLNVAPDHIMLVAGDSSMTPYDAGTFGSSNVYVNGNAVKAAASELLSSMKKQAAEYLNMNPEESKLSFDTSGFHAEDGTLLLSFRAFCSLLSSFSDGRTNLEESSSYPCRVSPSPFVATFVSIRIDRHTGKIHIDECINAVDCGTVMNPAAAIVQIQGGTAQGIGFAIYENYNYSKTDNRLTTWNYQSYKIPCQMDLPKTSVIFCDSYEPTGPFGAKSVGEIATNAPAPAIANAIFNACGVNVTKLPILPEYMLDLLEQKETGEAISSDN